MAEIVTMSGDTVDTESPFRDQDIQNVLDYYNDLNSRGELKAIAVTSVTINEECIHYNCMQQSVHPMTLLGAIEFLKDDVISENKYNQDELSAT